MEPVARSGDVIGTPLAAASVKPRKEIPLDGFLPESYIAMLEGTLLVNGDLKARHVLIQISSRPFFHLAVVRNWCIQLGTWLLLLHLFFRLLLELCLTLL